MAGPDTKNTETPQPIWGFGPPSPEPDTKNLDALLTSLTGSADRYQKLWIWFVGATIYLAFTVLGTTHRALLLNESFDLTGLQKELPIPINAPLTFISTNFFVIAPLLYLIFHFFVALMWMPLIGAADVFESQLQMTFRDHVGQDRYRARAEIALFLQTLIGTTKSRGLFQQISLFTIFIAPLAMLVLMQMMFLPSHHLLITWWHRTIVIADLVLILVMTYRWFLSRDLRRARLVFGDLSRKPRRTTAMAFWVLLAITLTPLAFWLSFRQGRWAGETRPSSLAEWEHWMAGEPAKLPEVNPDYAATRNGVVFGMFPDRLDLRYETIVGEKRLEETKKQMDSRGGDFVPTIRLDGRDLQAAELGGADLRGVSLSGAVMQGANLVFARLDGARLHYTDLQGTDLAGAELQGTDLGEAQLHGARLDMAQLQGALLDGARLQGARLSGAELQGANLVGAQLQGADLSDAGLQGADLRDAQLQGANFRGARLQGATLRGADLRGADLSEADLSDSDLDGAFVFRTIVAGAQLSTSAIRSVHAALVKPSHGSNNVEQLNDDDVDAWRLKPGVQTPAQDAADETKWNELTKQSLASDPDGARHRQRLAALLGDLACDRDGAPYVARGLIGFSSRLTTLGDQLESVRKRMEAGRDKSEDCPGVVGFSEDDWRRLDAIKPETAPADH